MLNLRDNAITMHTLLFQRVHYRQCSIKRCCYFKNEESRKHGSTAILTAGTRPLLQKSQSAKQHNRPVSLPRTYAASGLFSSLYEHAMMYSRGKLPLPCPKITASVVGELTEPLSVMSAFLCLKN